MRGWPAAVWPDTPGLESGCSRALGMFFFTRAAAVGTTSAQRYRTGSTGDTLPPNLGSSCYICDREFVPTFGV